LSFNGDLGNFSPGGRKSLCVPEHRALHRHEFTEPHKGRVRPGEKPADAGERRASQSTGAWHGARSGDKEAWRDAWISLDDA